VQLETTQTGKDSTYTYFEAKTTAFANFAITELKGEIVLTATPEMDSPFQATGDKETPGATESQKKGTPGFEFTFALGVLSALYLFSGKRR
jgi:hypothetical protein